MNNIIIKNRISKHSDSLKTADEPTQPNLNKRIITVHLQNFKGNESKHKNT